MYRIDRCLNLELWRIILTFSIKFGVVETPRRKHVMRYSYNNTERRGETELSYQPVRVIW